MSSQDIRETSSTRERFQLFNSLGALVKALEKKHTLIDLRNGGSVTGLIKKVDGFMNVEMEKVIFYDARGAEHRFRDFFISARNIQYVHIPKEFPIEELMRKQIGDLQNMFQRKPKTSTFKIRRAQRYNQEILQSNYQQPGTSNTNLPQAQ